MESKDWEGTMITFDFGYYKPDTIVEAIKVYKELTGHGKKVIYYAGGTEIITMARVNQIRFDAVIDIKGIPECNVLEFQGDKLIIGAAISLTKISDSGLFPLLGAVCRRAADHTARDKITLGGNICGKTSYKEAILPLLVSESEVMISGESNMKKSTLAKIFRNELMLKSGEFLVQAAIDKSYTAMPYDNIKKTRQEKMGYPLITVAAVMADKQIKIAFSGVCSFPFRTREIEDELNNRTISLEERINNTMKHLPAPLLGDMLGSAGYRDFVMRNVLSETCEKLGGLK